MRFRGYAYHGPKGDESSPLAGVELQLWAFAECSGGDDGDLLRTVTSDASGYYSAYIENGNPKYWNRFELRVTDSGTLVSDGPVTEDGQVLDNNTVAWCQPDGGAHKTDWFFVEPTPTPTVTPTPTITPSPTPTPNYPLWLPLFLRQGPSA
jgi:hypothetical protein